jgi:hypothetical protein
MGAAPLEIRARALSARPTARDVPRVRAQSVTAWPPRNPRPVHLGDHRRQRHVQLAGEVLDAGAIGRVSLAQVRGEVPVAELRRAQLAPSAKRLGAAVRARAPDGVGAPTAAHVRARGSLPPCQPPAARRNERARRRRPGRARTRGSRSSSARAIAACRSDTDGVGSGRLGLSPTASRYSSAVHPWRRRCGPSARYHSPHRWHCTRSATGSYGSSPRGAKSAVPSSSVAREGIGDAPKPTACDRAHSAATGGPSTANRTAARDTPTRSPSRVASPSSTSTLSASRTRETSASCSTA